MIGRFDLLRFIRDAAITIVSLPLHLIVGIAAAFMQFGTQLYYDVKNNIHND